MNVLRAVILIRLPSGAVLIDLFEESDPDMPQTNRYLYCYDCAGKHAAFLFKLTGNLRLRHATDDNVFRSIKKLDPTGNWEIQSLVPGIGRSTGYWTWVIVL